MPAFLNDIYCYEAVISYRVPALSAITAAIAKARELGLITFYEIDDLIFDADEYPSSLASYDGQIGAEEYAGPKMGVPLFAHALSLCILRWRPRLRSRSRWRVTSTTEPSSTATRWDAATRPLSRNCRSHGRASA